MKAPNNRLLFCFIVIIALFQPVLAISGPPVDVREILSIKTGEGPKRIGNQFNGVPTEPYNGFAVDAKGNILISDTLQSRILRYDSKGQLLNVLEISKNHLFYPENICTDHSANIYVHNERTQEIIVLSSGGKLLRNFRPSNEVQSNGTENVIISHTCSNDSITITHGIQEPKMIRPVYEDEYDQTFQRINRTVYDDEVAYYKAIRGAGKEFEKHFEDAAGNMYGYPIVKDWYGKYLPMRKYSPAGTLLSTIDGALLTKCTKYKIHDYLSGKNMIGLDLKETKGNVYMIVNWYVTSNGVIYVLIANNNYVRVLRVHGLLP